MAENAPQCVFFLKGLCRYGVQCRFRHDASQPSASSLPFHQRESIAVSNQSHFSHRAQDAQSAALRVMTYNVLADAYAHEHAGYLYTSVTRAALDWKTRTALIAREVAHWQPDVVCLQEVDHYKQLSSLLGEHGYAGSYAQRTGGRPDGLATFWRSSRFEAASQRRVEFSGLGLKDNVCQIVTLRAIRDGAKKRSKIDSSIIPDETLTANVETQQHIRFSSDDEDPEHVASGGGKASTPTTTITVANIHVLFNPKRGDIKLAQVRTMMEHAALEAAETRSPIIVCGDFNSAPESPLYHFMRHGELDLRQTDRRRVSGQVEVAGRTGWPALRGTFYSALRHPGRGEEEALAIALGSFPPYSSITDPHSSVFEPRLLATLDAPYTAEQVVLEDGRASPTPSSSSASSRASSSKSGKRAWTPEEVATAVGRPVQSSLSRTVERHTSTSNSNSVKEDAMTVRHPLKLESAYRAITGSEPMYTTVHDRYVGTVDYIFYTPGESSAHLGAAKLRPMRVMAPPPLSSLPHGLPSRAWPSDHISLVADFELVPRTGGEKNASENTTCRF